MARGPRHALTDVWWAWNHPRIRSALTVPLTDHYCSVVERCLKENAGSGKTPATWKDFGELLRRNDHNAERLGSREYQASLQVMLGMASVLGIPVRQLFPSTRDWIERATVVLCGGAVSPADARTYAAYRLGNPAAHNPRLDPAGIEVVFKELRDDFRDVGAVERAIGKVVEQLEPILQVIDSELPER